MSVAIGLGAPDHRSVRIIFWSLPLCCSLLQCIDLFPVLEFCSKCSLDAESGINRQGLVDEILGSVTQFSQIFLCGLQGLAILN